MPFKDLREFTDRLEKEGDLRRIQEEVNWDLEVGAIVRWTNEKGLAAPFFEKIKGYPPGYRILGSPLGTQRRLAIAMDMSPDTSTKELQEEYLKRKKSPIKPVLVKDGPCKENVHIGDKVDLLEFPVPVIHEGDGGRFIGSWHLDISKDPESDWVNWGMHRHQVHLKDALGIMAEPYTHLGGVFARKYQARNRPMEVAVALGTEPICAFMASTPVPYGVSEVDIAGALRGEPVEMVKCETVDLEVPATSEIVIEGEIRPDDVLAEGPFGEYTGYMAGGIVPRKVIRVKAITHRNSPILSITNMGMPIDDSDVVESVSLAAELHELLAGRGLPVTGVSISPEACHLLVVVAIKVPYANVASDVTNVIWASRYGVALPYIAVVEDDVDPFNVADVLHALISKCHPRRGIVIQDHTPAGALIPWLSRNERKYHAGARAYFDCTWPMDWDQSEIPRKMSFAKAYPPEVQQQALAKCRKAKF